MYEIGYWLETKNDDERKMSFDEYRKFGEKLENLYQSLNYQIIEVPRCPLLKEQPLLWNTLIDFKVMSNE
jgi:predicted ATPase